MKQISRKTEYNGIKFQSKGEASAYKKLVNAFGEDNVEYETKSFTLSFGTHRYGCRVFRSYGKTLVERTFPNDRSDRILTPDFFVKYRGRKFIVEFKNAFTQSADYSLRRTLFLRSQASRYYTAFFEPKSQEEVRETIAYIMMKDWDNE